MQERSLIRAVEIGLVGAVLAAAALLGTLVWSAHQLDRRARAGEAEIVRQMLEPEIAEFRQGLAMAAADPQGWSDLDRQRQMILPPGAAIGERQGRVAQLVSAGTSRQRIERLREGQGRGDAGKPRVDFFLLGAEGGEELALVSPLRSPEGTKPSLAIALVDFAELAQRLERHSIHLLPLRAQGEMHGELHLAGFYGDIVAVLRWQSDRPSDLLRTLVLPLFVAVLALAIFCLMILLDRTRQVAAGVGARSVQGPFELPQSPGEMRLAAARNPAKIAPSMQVS